jgi:hypothetical protein
MTMQVRFGGAWKSISGAKAYVAGAWRNVVAIKGYVDGTWVDLATLTSPMTLSVSPSTVAGSGTLSAVLTVPATATPVGGSAPFTYSWVKQSGGNIIALSQTSASTRFQGADMAVLETRTAVFRCTCTDSLGTVRTADVSVSVHRRQDREVVITE